MDDINRSNCFDTNDMDGLSPNYRFVLCSECADNINDCVDEDNTLINPYDSETGKGVNIIETYGENDGQCSLLWSKGINGERTITVGESVVVYDFGSTIQQVKAIFLVSIVNGSGYVLAYSINNKPITTGTSLIMPVDDIVWAITY